MPVKIPDALPATRILTEENIFVMTEKRSASQDIRPLHIAILNLMPTKEDTETQLLRLIGNTSLQVEITLLYTKSYAPRNTDDQHLEAFYRTFDDVRNTYFDGVIITGAPVEKLDFEDVKYWEELKDIMAWADARSCSTLFICWAAQAGLHYHYGIHKRALPEKMFGVFPHQVLARGNKLVRGFDDVFNIPVSRHTGLVEEEVLACPDLTVLATSEESGIGLIVSQDGRRVFATGHSEYNGNTLANEYFRDVNKGLPIEMPKHYFPADDPRKEPVVRWRSHANLLFANWLNYFVYQETPYELSELAHRKGTVTMQIPKLLRDGRVHISCEVFPPKEFSGLAQAEKVARQIAALHPAFVSVTYGAAGNTAAHTLDIARAVQEEGCTPLYHLTCVTSTAEQMAERLAALQAAGMENILALRGDIPDGLAFPGPRQYHYAAELVKQVKEFGGFAIGAACYPEGHPESPSKDRDLDFLRRKVDAGAEFLTTQMFFDNNVLYNFLYRALQKGISVPVAAGIMPVVNAVQIKRICTLSGASLPPRFAAIVDRFSQNPDAMRQAGIAFATEQIIDLIANGVNNIHIYTMNRPQIAAAIFQNLSEIIRE